MLVDANLSGLLVGMTLATTAGDIYRALIEATAFSTRRILDAFEGERIPVKELIAVGGLAERSPLLLQIYADVTRRPDRRFAAAVNASAPRRRDAGRGGGRAGGGRPRLVRGRRAARWPGLKTRARRAGSRPARTRYDALYRDWLELHDHFGKKSGSDEAIAPWVTLHMTPRSSRLATSRRSSRASGRSTAWTSTCGRERCTRSSERTARANRR